MPSVTIDAGVLAAPQLDVDAEAVYRYVETLLDWRRLLDEPWVAIYMSERASETLVADGLYPLRDSLRLLFAAKGVIEYDVNTVARVADTLLRLTPHFETIFKIKDVLCDDVHTEPDLLSIYTSENLTSELARCLVLIALLRNHCRCPIVDHALVVRPWNGKTIVQVKALVHDIDHSRDDLEAIPQPPEYLEGSVWVCQSFRELVSSIDETTVWRSALDDEGMMVAIHIALYKSRLARRLEPDWGAGPGFRFGRKFTETARECCRDNPASLVTSLLRSMVETIDRLQLQDVHALRTSDSGGAPQRTRGNDKACRRDIDYEYHLHYWECEDGIEFGSVGPHNDFSIPA